MRTDIRTYFQASASQDPTRHPACSFEGSTSKVSFKPATLPPGWGVLGCFLQSFCGFGSKQSQNLACRSFPYSEQGPGTMVQCWDATKSVQSRLRPSPALENQHVGRSP